MILGTISSSWTLLSVLKEKKIFALVKCKSSCFDMPFFFRLIGLSKKKKIHEEYRNTFKKILFCQGTLTAFINIKIDFFSIWKILNIYNIFCPWGGFLPFLQNIMLMSMEFHPSPMDWVGISRSHASMHVWQLSLVIFRAAGMCNGRVCSGRERRNGYSLPQAILTLTDDEWDGEEWLSSFRLLWSAETGQGRFEFYCSMYKKSTGLSFFDDCKKKNQEC